MLVKLVVFLMFFCVSSARAAEYRGGKTYNSYRGLVMAGYQGWQNTPDDGANRGWHHYEGRNGFRPGSTNVDFWPDVSEYEKTYPTPFRFEDGSVARVYSPYDASSVNTHFRWMQEYGLDGVFMQRFVAEIRNKSGKNHFNRVLASAMTAANKYDRAICIMYDLSGMNPGEELLLLNDIEELSKEHFLKEHSKNPSYLYHNGRPLVAVWGVGFNDHRRYGIDEAQTIISGLKKLGYSIMLGVPTHWRRLCDDTESDARLHDLIQQCDVVMPWFVGRYDETTYNLRYHQHILDDISWAREHNVDYAPLCYPGFSWHNMHYPQKPAVEIPRNKGRFFQLQLDNAIRSGAEMIYIAMFDEIDEGTAIYKIARRVPVGEPGSQFVALEEGIGNDYYLRLAGEASKRLKHETAIRQKEPVDYVNPYIGNISHLLVPTFPTIHLPNSMLRVYPSRADYTSEYVTGLPIIVTNHREQSAFNLLPQIGSDLSLTKNYTYDNETIRPYEFHIALDDQIKAHFAVSHQSAMYEIDFADSDNASVVLTAQDGEVYAAGNVIKGWQRVGGRVSNNTRVYIYMESLEQPSQSLVLPSKDGVSGVALSFPNSIRKVHLRYGISFISEEQAKANLFREIHDYDVCRLAADGRRIWNETLNRINVDSEDENSLSVFYTSYYRTFERPVCMSEDGRYWSPFDGKVHEDFGMPFYNDDWIWDTYRAAHPLRTLLDQTKEEHILNSFLLMAEQMGTEWLPTFPELNGDSRRMNSNHGIPSMADALTKGLKVDAQKAFRYSQKALEEKTLAPWSGAKAGWIDQFYKEHGYIPALNPNEPETDPNVNGWEKRQPVAVTLGTSYDAFALSKIARHIAGHSKKKEKKRWTEMADKYAEQSLNYHKLYNAETGFFHPKNKEGEFIMPFDYRYDGGPGARHYYDENNGWIYRWDVPHNVEDLIRLMGGREQFVKNLNQTFAEPLGKSKSDFYAMFPDHTGNIGMFSMANEPSFHIPYLYNYAGQPWMTQKRIRQCLRTWYRNDLMGVPGDEDGGGMTAFVVFSSVGLYPVTPGIPVYNIGSPLFHSAILSLSNGRTFEVRAHHTSAQNKYIQSAMLNGEPLDNPWISHEQVMQGGVLELQMGPNPNKLWGASSDAAPPSAQFKE